MNLRAWFGWTDAAGIDGLDAQRPHVETHIRHLEQCGYAPNTIRQRITTLSSFYRWAAGEGHVAGNPFAGARRPRKPTESTAQHESMSLTKAFPGHEPDWEGGGTNLPAAGTVRPREQGLSMGAPEQGFRRFRSGVRVVRLPSGVTVRSPHPCGRPYRRRPQRTAR